LRRISLEYLRITCRGQKKKRKWKWTLHKRSGDPICASKEYQRWDGVTGSLERTFERSPKKVNVTVDGKHRGTLSCKDLSKLPKEMEDEG
jgi:hypothetical protein